MKAALFDALLPFCDDRRNATEDAVAAVLAVLERDDTLTSALASIRDNSRDAEAVSIAKAALCSHEGSRDA